MVLEIVSSPVLVLKVMMESDSVLLFLINDCCKFWLGGIVGSVHAAFSGCSRVFCVEREGRMYYVWTSAEK